MKKKKQRKREWSVKLSSGIWEIVAKRATLAQRTEGRQASLMLQAAIDAGDSLGRRLGLDFPEPPGGHMESHTLSFFSYERDRVRGYFIREHEEMSSAVARLIMVSERALLEQPADIDYPTLVKSIISMYQTT